MRKTKQKDFVLNNLKNRFDHPSAKQIALDAQKQDVNIGVTSVYRILNNLTEKGLANKIVTKDNVTHYDFNRKNHIHLACNYCGEIQDISPDEILKTTNVGNNFMVTLQDITLYGVCADCQTKERKLKYQ